MLYVLIPLEVGSIGTKTDLHLQTEQTEKCNSPQYQVVYLSYSVLNIIHIIKGLFFMALCLGFL